MQNMINRNHQPMIFLKRKHKLYKALLQHINNPDVDDPCSQINIVNLYEFIINKEHQLHQINYYIKHEFICNIEKYSKKLIDLIWQVKSYRPNHIISFIYYRLSRKYPILYWHIYQFLQQNIQKEQFRNQQQTCVLVDLFLYGFPLTQEQFLEKIFPSFKHFLVQMIPRYLDALTCNQMLSLKSQKIVKASFQQWIQLKKIQIVHQFDTLKQKSIKLQKKMIKQACVQSQETQYENELQSYETSLYRFRLASEQLNIPFQSQIFKLKPIFQLKKECLTFKSNFQASQYEKSLYFNHNQEIKSIESIKKSEIIWLQQHQAYTNQIKHCSNISQCIKLSGFFIEQLNIQHNRQQLIQVIINECYYYNNISYIIKILSQINQAQPQIKEYCQLKGKKICSQNKMNQKYQRILCQMSRFGLIDENILLDYCQKILKCENSLVTKEIQSILQQLGTIIYYRCLQTHIRINNLFQRMQTIIKSKMIHFNIQNLLQLKNILNFLRNYKNDKTQSDQMTKIQIRINFNFILKKMERLLKNQEYKSIQEYLTQGINQEEFLSVYYYSSLIKQLNSKQLNQIIYRRTISQIFCNIASGNLQNGIKWSRFLGELYSYVIINRKKLIEALNLILNRTDENNDWGSKIKFICAAIQIAKDYLLDTQQNKENKLIILFLFQVKKILLSNQSLQIVTQCQIDDIMDHFHPYLSKIKNLQQIKLIETIQTTESSSKSSSFHNNLYYYLDLLHSGVDAKELTRSQTSPVKYIEKPIIKYIEKCNEDKKQEQVSKDIEGESQQSYKTSQTIERSNKKVMRVIGRDKKTKHIKIMTFNHVQQTV